MTNNNLTFAGIGTAPELMNSPTQLSECVPGGTFMGPCTIVTIDQDTSASHSQIALEISDPSATLPGFMYSDRVPPKPGAAWICGLVHGCSGRPSLELLSVNALPNFSLSAMPIHNLCEAARGAVRRLWAIYTQLQPHMQAFVDEVFSHPEVRRKFFEIEGSYNCHHDYPGGLAVHSVESAEIVLLNASYSLDNRDEIEAAAIAALFHDIGKIGQRKSRIRHPEISHNARTTWYCGQALSKLEHHNPLIAEIMLAAFTGHLRKGKNACIVTELVSSADRISAMLSARKKAERKAEPWQKILPLDCTGQKRTFFRL